MILYHYYHVLACNLRVAQQICRITLVRHTCKRQIQIELHQSIAS